MRPVIENKRRILAGAADIERQVELIIAHYFFGHDPDNKDGKNRFMTLVLTSDWCSFGAKRRLISHIVNDTDALKGQAKSDYEKVLRDVMSARNAFAHGTLSTDGRKVKLAYFEGGPREKFLDDNYFDKIEHAINNGFSTTREVAIKTGAIRESGQT